jgi:hypothetical protein
LKNKTPQFWLIFYVLLAAFASLEFSLYTPDAVKRIDDHDAFDSQKLIVAQLNYLNSLPNNPGAGFKPPPAPAPEPPPVIGYPAPYYGRERIISAGYENNAHFITWGLGIDLLVCLSAAFILSGLFERIFKSLKSGPTG